MNSEMKQLKTKLYPGERSCSAVAELVSGEMR